MASRKNRECLTCGTKYSYCPNCNRNEPYWMADFHDENCKDIFQTCTAYNVGLLSKEEAKGFLEQCDLSNKENFKDCVKRDLENIFFEEPKTKRGKKAEISIIEETAPVEQIHEVVEEKAE